MSSLSYLEIGDWSLSRNSFKYIVDWSIDESDVVTGKPRFTVTFSTVNLLKRLCSAFIPVCDETQNLNDTDSETFFSEPNFFETDSETFFGTKNFRDRFRDFFSVLIFFETGSKTFFGIKFFTRPVPIP